MMLPMPASNDPPRQSAFYKQVAQDFTDTFLNVEEFGRVVKWNGRELACVESAAPPLLEAPGSPGVLEQTKQIVCRADDMPVPPVPTEVVNLDGVDWIVVDVNKPFAHVVITLGRQSS